MDDVGTTVDDFVKGVEFYDFFQKILWQVLGSSLGNGILIQLS